MCVCVVVGREHKSGMRGGTARTTILYIYTRFWAGGGSAAGVCGGGGVKQVVIYV